MVSGLLTTRKSVFGPGGPRISIIQPKISHTWSTYFAESVRKQNVFVSVESA